VLGLAKPTPDEEKKQRPAPGGSGKMLTYIDARYVMDVLDREVGPTNWQNQFVVDGSGNLTCGIGILVERHEMVKLKDAKESIYSEWVWKWDVGTESTIEATKGNYSDALKRAGVHWGIARDLYDERTPSPFRASASSAGPSIAPAPGRMASAPLVSDWQCPIHHSYKVVPAGISTRTGKPYPAFVVCGERGCEEKPPRGHAPSTKATPTYVELADYPVNEESFEDDGWVPS
jgi:hypothetical protein